MVNGDGHDVAPDPDLLRLLDPDPGRAASAYEVLRRRLIKYFEWRQCAASDDLADEVIVRGIRRMHDGVTIKTDPVRYFFGVARMVYLEYQRADKIDFAAVPPDEVADGDRLGRVELRICLEQVLSRLTPEEGDLLVRYHQSNPSELRRLAAELGLAPGTLRVRIHRLHLRIRKALGIEAARFCKKKK
jgi:RNA polymerase sigma factor (sigma-70 family)